MRVTMVAMAAACALLAGCSGSNSNSNGGDATKGADGAPAAAAGNAGGGGSGGAHIAMQPGNYETRVQVTKFDIPGLPAAQAQAMRQAMANATGQSARRCLTPEEAARGPAAMAEQASRSGQCTVDRYDVNGENISGHITCNTPQGRLAQTMTGTMSSTGTDMKIEQELSAASFPQGKAQVELQVTSTRVGDCPADGAAH